MGHSSRNCYTQKQLKLKHIKILSFKTGKSFLTSSSPTSDHTKIPILEKSDISISFMRKFQLTYLFLSSSLKPLMLLGGNNYFYNSSGAKTVLMSSTWSNKIHLYVWKSNQQTIGQTLQRNLKRYKRQKNHTVTPHQMAYDFSEIPMSDCIVSRKESLIRKLCCKER